MKGKIVGYRSVSGILPLNRVIYIIYGKQIVFSGLHSNREGPVGSTINFAETIILAIAANEGIDPRGYQFFDLQTHKGYGRYKSGDYTFNLLHPVWSDSQQPVQMHWTEGHPDPRVLEDFAECIWEGKPCSKPRNLPVVYGSLRPLVADTPSPRKELTQ